MNEVEREIEQKQGKLNWILLALHFDDSANQKGTGLSLSSQVQLPDVVHDEEAWLGTSR